MTPAEFEKKINAAIEAEDLEALKKLQNEFVDDGETTLPFQPSVRLRGKAGNPAQEGDVGIALANGLSRAIRKIEYKLKRSFGYSGPIIVSEGDSWFQFPVVLTDVIDKLAERYAILSLGAAGDTLANRLDRGEYRDAIVEEKADFFLFSASGNDALGGGRLADLLNLYEPGMEVADIIRQDQVAGILQKVEAGFETIIREARDRRSVPWLRQASAATGRALVGPTDDGTSDPQFLARRGNRLSHRSAQ